MAQRDNKAAEKIVATIDLGTTQRTIGGVLPQFDVFKVERDDAISILGGVGLPAIAFDDPSFPISLTQDFEILNEIRKHLPSETSIEARMFWMMLGTRVNMLGPMGMVWQSAPTLFDALQVLATYPQAQYGHSRMVIFASAKEERIEYHLDKGQIPLGAPDDVEATYRYVLLLELTASVAANLDIVSDRSLVRSVHVPFAQPPDWSAIAGLLDIPIEFDAAHAGIVFKPGYLRDVPRRAHDISFRLATKIVGKESALLAEDTSFRNRVARWLWASSPPLKKAEIARLLGVSERSLTRQLACEGTHYNALFAEVQSERARNLLANPKLKISEVAYRMGYSDPAAFTRAFTNWQGITPSDWRAGQ
ncbi:MAG: helix-turn-helix domain-containing protein [Pseudomonadota bacterium]